MSDKPQEIPTKEDLSAESQKVTALSTFVTENFGNPAINPRNTATLSADNLLKASSNGEFSELNKQMLSALGQESSTVAKLYSDNHIMPDKEPSRNDIAALDRLAKAMPDELPAALKASELLDRKSSEITYGRTGLSEAVNRQSILRSDLERATRNEGGRFTKDEQESLNFALSHYDEIEKQSYRNLPMPMIPAIIPNDLRLYKESELRKFQPVRSLANRINDFICQE